MKPIRLVCVAIYSVVGICVASTTFAQQLTPIVQTPTVISVGSLPPSASSPAPAGLGPGIEILSTRVPPATFAVPVPPVKGVLDIDSATAIRIGLDKLAQRYGTGLRLLSIIPLADIHDNIIAYDIDVALPGCTYSSYGEIATYWRNYCASVTRHPLPATKGVEAIAPKTLRGVPGDSALVIASITVSASYDYPAVRSYSRTPSSFYSSGWAAQQIAAQTLSATGPVQLEKIYLTGPGARSYVFNAGGRRIVVDGQEPFAWYDYEPFHATCLENEQRRVAEVSQGLQEKGSTLVAVRDTLRASNRAVIETSPTTSKQPLIDEWDVPGYPDYFQPLEWHYGCSPTAAAMVFEYWENYDWYGNLNAGYLRRSDAFEGDLDCHVATAQTSLANCMHTDESGGTWPTDIYPGMVNCANVAGYCFSGGRNWTGWTAGGWHWDDIRQDIDDGYPVVWSLNWFPGTSGGNHSVTAVGYTGDGTVVCHSTWWTNGAEKIYVNYAGGPLDHSNGVSPHPGCPVPYDVHLTSPLGYRGFGSCGSAGPFAAGTPIIITWNNWGKPAAFVNLKYSVDGGARTRIAQVPDNGSFAWTPECSINSTACRIWVEQFGDPWTRLSADGSYGDFTIVPTTAPSPPSTPFVYAPNGYFDDKGTSCYPGGTCTLSAEETTCDPVSWSWSSSCGGTFGSPNAQTTTWTAPAGSECVGPICQIMATASNTQGSTAGSLMITVASPPSTPVITGLPSTVCAGQTHMLSASASCDPTWWLWLSDCGGTFSSVGSSTTFWTAPASYTGPCQITVIVGNKMTGNSGTAASVSTTVTTSSPNNLAPTGLPGIVCAGQTYNLSATATGNPTSWSWSSNCGGSFGSPTSSSTSWTAPSENAGYVGACGITVIAANDCGSIGATMGPTIISQPGPPTITGLPATACGGGQIYSLSATSSGLVSNWSWSSSCGGSFGSPTSATTTWTSPTAFSGSCLITVVAANSCGSTSADASIVIDLQPPGTPTIAGLSEAHSGVDVVLSASASNNPTQWSWSSACGGTFNPPNGNPTTWVPPCFTGPCQISVTATNACGPSAAGSKSINVTPTPAVPSQVWCSPGCHYIDLGWRTVLGATWYRIYEEGTLIDSVQAEPSGYMSYRENVSGGPLCFQVTAKNGCGESARSTQVCGTAFFMPPAAPPTGLTGDPGCGIHPNVQLHWNSSPGAEGYEIRRDTYVLDYVPAVPGSVQSYTNINAPLGSHWYEVYSVNGCGHSPQWSEVNVMNNGMDPGNVGISSGWPGCGTISFTIGTDPLAIRYLIYRDTTAVGQTSTALYDSTNASPYIDHAPSSTHSFYSVAVRRSCGVGSQSYPRIRATACPTSLPDVPTGVTCLPGCGIIVLNWEGGQYVRNIIYRDGVRYDSTVGAWAYADYSPGVTQHCYTVSAMGEPRICPTCPVGESEQSSPVCGSAEFTSLDTPTGLVSASGCGIITLNWSAVTGATSYYVYRDGTYWRTVTETFCADSTPGTAQRCYTVKAIVYGCGASALSLPSCGTASSMSPPSAPTAFVSAPGCDTITLNWNAVSGASKYIVFRDGTRHDSVTAATYTDATPGLTQRCYKVLASNGCVESDTSQASCATANPTTLASPSGFTTTSGCGSITLNWSAVPSAAWYLVYRDNVLYDSATVATYTDATPGPSQRCYTVSTRSGCGQESGQSSSSCGAANPATVSPPSGMTCALGCGSITLHWSAVTGAVTYVLFRDGLRYDSTTATTCTDHAPGTTQHCYSAVAQSECGESRQSLQTCGATSAAAPAVPSNLSCTSAIDTIRLDWTAVTGTTRYVVLRDGERYDSTETLLYADHTPGIAQRCYTLLAKNACGESGQSLASCCAALPPCLCPGQGDINGDGVIDVFDVIGVIGIAFSGDTDPLDGGCPNTRGDVDNNGVADVFDVIYLIATAFSGGPNPVNPCGP